MYKFIAKVTLVQRYSNWGHEVASYYGCLIEVNCFTWVKFPGVHWKT